MSTYTIYHIYIYIHIYNMQILMACLIQFHLPITNWPEPTVRMECKRARIPQFGPRHCIPRTRQIPLKNKKKK